MRCFIAIELDADVRTTLTRLQRNLTLADVPVRWVRPEQMHITLKFLGDVPAEAVTSIGQAMAEVARDVNPFDVAVVGAGCFPPSGRAVRVVWAGLHDPTGELHRCRNRLETALEARGFARDTRPFSAHLTLGRTRSPHQAGPLRSRLEAEASRKFGEQAVDSMILFESVLRKSGPAHTVLVRETLGSNGRPGVPGQKPPNPERATGVSP